jgi:hypothetical protein
MKHFSILLLLLLTIQRGQSQTLLTAISEPKSIKELREIDAQLSNPLSRSLITGKAYNRLVYQNQVAIGGSGIKEGRTIGANATVDDVLSGNKLTVFHLKNCYHARSPSGLVAALSV